MSQHNIAPAAHSTVPTTQTAMAPSSNLAADVHDADIAEVPNAENEDDDTASVTSTLYYDHEAFETFQQKVVDMALEQFQLDPTEIQVERMKGGSFNRVIGVTITPKPKQSFLKWFAFICLGGRNKVKFKKASSYIIRIPRSGGSIAQDVNILKTVGAHLALPVPEVIKYDLTSNNLFASPYMIQNRLPGQSLSQLWKTLNLKQKECVAIRVTKLTEYISTFEAPPGEITLDEAQKSVADGFRTEKLCIPARGAVRAFFNKPNTWPAEPQTPVEHLIEQCERWREYQEAQGGSMDEIWDPFIAISKSLEARGFLSGSSVLVHGDLKDYNLLAEVRSATEVEITGVLDWDSAVFAPEFMAYRAPFWMWLPEDIESYLADKEGNVDREPVTEEDRILKQTFLEHASEKYKRYALAPEALLARRMFFILKQGIFGPWNFQETNDIIREWNELHPEDDVGLSDIDSSDSEASSDDES